MKRRPPKTLRRPRRLRLSRFSRSSYKIGGALRPPRMPRNEQRTTSELVLEIDADGAGLIGGNANDRRLLPGEGRVVDCQCRQLVGQIGAEQVGSPRTVRDTRASVEEGMRGQR